MACDNPCGKRNALPTAIIAKNQHLQQRGDGVSIRSISKKRFDALVHKSRSPFVTHISREISWWSTHDESVIGVVLLDLVDEDYGAIVLGRDKSGRYRCFDISDIFYDEPNDAKNWLHRAMGWHSRDGVQVFPQGDEGKVIDLFSQIVPDSKLHPGFAILRSSDAHLPSREILKLIAPHFEDIDGNFVEQFQTTGFDSRMWELYLHSYFIEEGLTISRNFSSPDFIVEKYGKKVGVEAVIVGRRQSNPARYINSDIFRTLQRDVASENENAMPIRFGSPLFSKLQKEYWNLTHIKGNPLVFAIADFHDDFSMTWSSTALVNYLYGVRHGHHYGDSGKLIIDPIRIDKHVVGGKEIPSGFFLQPNVENISAVLFSSSGTISKFSRMGLQAGFKHPEVTAIRMGMSHDHDEDASLPRFFRYIVDESCTETWAEGISMFHNPNAVHPVPIELFPSIAHHNFSNGNFVSMLPEFFPYSSLTHHFIRNRSRT